MTAKEYYKQTSDIAYYLGEVHFDNHKVIATIFLNGKDRKDAEKLLADNDFYSIPPRIPTNFEDGKITLEITFVYDSHAHDVYNLNVCGVIDCSSADGNYVLSCDHYELVDEFRDDGTQSDKEEKDDGKDDANDFMVDFFGGRNPFAGFGSIFDMKLPDFDKMVEDAKKSGGNCYVRQYSNVNGHVKEKVWENGKLTERECLPNAEAPKTEIEVKDEKAVKDAGINPKTELKNLLK